MLDLTNQRFGKLVALEPTELRKRGRVVWKCICDCGNEAYVVATDLVKDNTKSCGCMSSRNFVGERNKTHGMSKTKIYGVWRLMNERCTKPQNKSYKDYGARGIQVKWNTFEEFYLDMGETYKEGLTIDRIDSKGNYCKDNCRWATRADQNRNKKSNIMVSFNGETKPLKTMCIQLGIDYKKAYYKYKTRKWTFQQIVEYYLER